MDDQNQDGISPFADATPRRDAVLGLIGLQAGAEAKDKQAGSEKRRKKGKRGPTGPTGPAGSGGGPTGPRARSAWPGSTSFGMTAPQCRLRMEI